MKMVLVSAETKRTFGVLPSAIMKRSGKRRAVRTKARSSVLHAALAFAGRLRLGVPARRRGLQMAVEVGGMGVPKLTVTG